MKVLFVNHNLSEHCGVYSMGKRIGEILTLGNPDKYSYCEVGSSAELIFSCFKPFWDVVIYNYHPAVMGWLPGFMASKPYPSMKHVGIIHEVTQETVNMPPEGWLDGWIAADPSLDLHNRDPRWFKSVRPLPFPIITKGTHSDDCYTIGTFGFAFPNKGFEKVAKYVFKARENCNLRMHITKAHFSPDSCEYTPQTYFNLAKQHINSPGQKITFTNNFMSDKQIIEWLNENDLNLLFYDENQGRGISSVADFCIASGSNLLVSNTTQFRHFNEARPDKTLLFIDVPWYQKVWSHENFVADFDRITEAIKNG